MKQIKLLLLLASLAAAQNLFAYKIIKYKEHWALFGGFDVITYDIDAHEGADGKLYIDQVTVNCKGWGNDKCQYEGQKVTNGTVITFDQANENIVNEMFERAEVRQEGGDANGTISETFAIQQQDGSYKYFRYVASWTANDANIITLDVNQINY